MLLLRFEDMEVAVKDQIGSTSECIAASWEELGKTELEKVSPQQLWGKAVHWAQVFVVKQTTEVSVQWLKRCKHPLNL